MIAAGIDLGGTKTEIQLFDENWDTCASRRSATPSDYTALLDMLGQHIAWAQAQTGPDLPIGIGAAGLVHPVTGLVLAANLCASGHPLPADISAAAGQPITYLNDCKAMALSEAVFGAGRGHKIVLSMTLGTGIGGGIAIDGALLHGPNQMQGEVGHSAAPAHLVAEYGLPLVRCGCGRIGCAETLIAGPGLTRICNALTGQVLPPEQITARKDGDMQTVWTLWCDLVADLMRNLTLTIDPNIIVIGGGLSQVGGVADDLTAALMRARLADFPTPPIVTAAGGSSSGARGAAYAAWQEGMRHG
ncbi:ROK family protein [Yoonia sp. BS5-3]|uniref:ROK family protein n=1 Tax=Yoonia phaeophyticola TaxID=3137369 RepID=A0ABZ2V653_9RHOB